MEIVIILLLIFLNGVFALAEIAVVSSRKARLLQWANDGDSRAAAALALAENPTRFLSTVQFGITLISTLAGAFGGATIADRLAAVLRTVPRLAPYSSSLSLVLVVLVITYLSLVLGELVPKRLALLNAERIAMAVAGPMRGLSRVAAPVVHLLTASTDLVLHVIGSRAPADPPVTEEEITMMVGQGAQAGVFEDAEPDLVRGVFRLGDLDVGAIMTPRLDIIWLDLDEPPAETQRRIHASIHSHFPAAHGSLDNVAGVVYAKDLLARSLAGEPFDVSALLVPPLYVPESLPALQLLERFQQSRIHIALVIDEYGGIQGLATMTDVMEAIVGDLSSIREPMDPEIVRRDDGSWLLDGMLSTAEFKEALHLREMLPNEGHGDYQTLGGFVMMTLGRIPTPGEHFDYQGLRFEVLDMDGHRVDKVMVTAVPA